MSWPSQNLDGTHARSAFTETSPRAALMAALALQGAVICTREPNGAYLPGRCSAVCGLIADSQLPGISLAAKNCGSSFTG
jgi:hypothetical protein